MHLCIVLCVPQIQVMCPSFNDNSCQCIRHTLCNLGGESEREREREREVCTLPNIISGMSYTRTIMFIIFNFDLHCSTQPVKNHYRIAGNIGGN